MNDQLYFSSSSTNTTAPAPPNKPVTENEAAIFFGVTSNDNNQQQKKISYTPVTTEQFFSRLAELPPQAFGLNTQSRVNTNLITPPVQQQRSQRDVNLYYVTEIAQFSSQEVEAAHKSRYDNQTGQIYGPITDIPSGTLFHSRQDLSQVHRDSSSSCTYTPNGTPASSVLLLDTNNHDDRGNCAIFVGDRVMTTHAEPPATGANLALIQNVKQKVPVRVIRGHETNTTDSSLSRHVPHQGYRYDGIYFVGDYWYEKLDDNIWQYVFKLVRVYGQPALPSQKELYRSLFPPTERILENEVQMNGMDTSRQTFFPQPVGSLSSNNAIHALLQRHRQAQQTQVQNNNQQQNMNIQNMQKPNIQNMQQQANMNIQPNLSIQNNSMQQRSNMQQSNMQQQQQQPQYQMPVRTMQQSFIPRRSSGTIIPPSHPIQGFELQHSNIREMLSYLQSRNKTNQNRINTLNQNIQNIHQKLSSHTTKKTQKKEKKRAMTSRNKSFDWKLEEKGEKKQRKKRKVDQLSPSSLSPSNGASPSISPLPADKSSNPVNNASHQVNQQELPPIMTQQQQQQQQSNPSPSLPPLNTNSSQ